jgi:hypothetical protein
MVSTFIKCILTQCSFDRAWTGNIALELLPSLKSILGVDLSENAVKKFNERFEKSGDLGICSAVSLDIQTDRSALEGKTFDIVYVS